jgi:putative transposase
MHSNMQHGFFYDFSNYGSYARLTHDGISQWHPAFLALGTTLEICAAAYRKFCQNYRPPAKPERKSHWGSKKLAGLKLKMKAKKKSPGQQSLWEEWNLPCEAVEAVAKPFVLANCLNPDIAILQFTNTT